MARNLNDEVENFFAEVDAITVTDGKDQDAVDALIIAPRTNWIVQVDSKSNLPFYHNFVTKETTWDLPDEYQSYLDAYKTYLQHKNDQSMVKEEEKKESPVLILPEGNARKRRRIKRAFMRANAGGANLSDAPVEFLSEYIAYSDSSSEDESLDSKRSSQTPTINEPMEVINETSESSKVFIGPQLPSSSPECEVMSSSPGELGKMLLNKFAIVCTDSDKLSRLQVVRIQFTTRFEDWKAGHLSDARYKEKLEEVSNFLREYEQDMQLKTSRQCPSTMTSPPIYRSESAVHDQVKEKIMRTTPLDVGENRCAPNSSNTPQCPENDIQIPYLNPDNSLSVQPRGTKLKQKYSTKDIGLDLLEGDRAVPKSPGKRSETQEDL